MSTTKFFYTGKYYSIYRISLGIISFAVMFLFTASCDVSEDIKPTECVCDYADSIGVWKLLGLAGERVTSIAIHPNKSSIIYAGTQKDFSAGTPGRLYKSIDCGKTWHTLMESANYSFTQIIFDNNNPDIIYCIPFGILKSIDGGKNWFEINNGIHLNPETRVSKISIDPEDSNILYAGTAGFFGGTLYKTNNGGQNWLDLYKSETETPGIKNGVTSLSIDQNNSNHLYVGTPGEGLILKSINGGVTFIKTGLTYLGSIVNDILIDKNNSQRIIAAVGVYGFLKSEDGGISYQTLNEGIEDSSIAIHILSAPDSITLYAVVTHLDNGWILKMGADNPIWIKNGIDWLRKSYYYSDLKISTDGKYTYFGTNGGIFRMQLF